MSDARDILDKVANGEMTPEEAELQLKMKPFVDLGFAKPDLHRGLRQGVPEVIYGEGKTPEQIDKITASLLEGGQETVLITRLSEEKKSQLQTPVKYYDVARIGVAGKIPEPSAKGTIVVATGGTSDLPVAEEAAVTAELLGNKVERVYDASAYQAFTDFSRIKRNSWRQASSLRSQAWKALSRALSEGLLTALLSLFRRASDMAHLLKDLQRFLP